MTALEQQIQDQKDIVQSLDDNLRQQLHRRGIIVASADPEVKDEQLKIADENIEDLRGQINYQKGILSNFEKLQTNAHEA